MEEREKRDGMGKTYDISRVRVIKSDVDNSDWWCGRERIR